MGRYGRIVVIAAVASLTAWSAPLAEATTRYKKPHPSSGWAKRVRPFVRFVEQERNLDFDHPVRVRFLSDEKLEKELRTDTKETKADRELERQIAGELLALGLLADEVDLSQAAEDLAAESVVGYYDPEKEELVVRDEGADSVEADITIVHELTHALQDQHFDLDRLYRRAEDGSQSLALDFLIEGDATAVENAYLDTLSKDEIDEYFGTVDDFAEEPLPEGVPYALDIFSAAPYVLGEAYVYALDPEGGTAGRDQAFDRPPKTEELLLDPVALEHHERAKKVPNPELAAGEERAYRPQQFGVFTLYLMLATRLDARTALNAVTGWGGDRYVGFERGEDICLRANVTGDTGRDSNELEDALRLWAAAMPAGAVEVERDGAITTFTACATEGVVEPTVEQFDSVFYNVLGGRIYTVLDIASYGVPLEDSRCIGDFVSTDPEVIALYDLVIAEGRDPTNRALRVVDDAYEGAFDACDVPLPG